MASTTKRLCKTLLRDISKVLRTTALSASSLSRRGHEKGQSNMSYQDYCLNDLTEQWHPLLNACSSR
jgi:hypothetical protein